MKFGIGAEKYGNNILIIVMLISCAFVVYIISRNLELRKIFNFRKELKHIKRQRKTMNKFKEQDGTLLGHIGKKEIYLPDDLKHIFICGTTGTGKTVTLSNFIKRSMEKNYPLLIIDGKGDTGKGSILDIIHTMNPRKKTYVINMNDPLSSTRYNPFKNASSTIAKDMLINMTEWSEEHYKVNAERYIQRVLTLFEIAKQPLSFRRIIKALNIEQFIKCSGILLKEGLIDKDTHLENIEIAQTSGKIAQSSIARFSSITEGEFGKIFADDGIDISQAMRENAIILFILNPLTYPELSPAMGKLALIDAKQAVGALFKIHKERTFFMFDEISSYASPSLVDLVNKSRSANVTCVLATQSLSDLDYAVNENFKEQIIENCNNYVVMRQNSGVNAEHWAKVLGTQSTLAVTHQLQQKGLNTSETGFGSARLVREYIYHPDEIKNLKTGEGIYLSKDCDTNSKIKIHKPF